MLRRALHVAWACSVVGVLALSVASPLPGQAEGRPWAVGLMAFPVAGAFILVHRPGNRIGRVLGLVGVCAALIFVGSWAAFTYEAAAWSPYVEALVTAPVVLQFWGLLALLYLFPTGSPPGRVSRWGFVALTCWAAVMMLLGVLRPGPLDITGRSNPLAVGPEAFRQAFEAGVVGIAVGAVAGVLVLLSRRRRAGPVERTQLKWFLSAAAFVMVFFAFVILAPDEPAAGGLVGAVEFGLVVIGFWALPAAIVVSVLRYRLYDIDRLVSRTVAYGLVVGLLAAVYAVGVFVLPMALPLRGDLAVAASTLAVAALFNPVRRRVRHAVDRRFNRPSYDAEREIARFAGRLRDQVDLDELTEGLAAAAATTLQPAAASVWLASTRGQGRSTVT